MADDKGTPVQLKRVGNLIAEGLHMARIIEWEERQGPSGTYWNYTLEVEEDSDDNGKRLWLIVSLAPAARWKLEEFLDAVAAPEEGVAHGPDFVNRLIQVQVVHEEFNGRVRANIARVYAKDAKVGAKPGSLLSLATPTAAKPATPVGANSGGSNQPKQLSLEELVKGLPEDILDEEDNSEEGEIF